MAHIGQEAGLEPGDFPRGYQGVRQLLVLMLKLFGKFLELVVGRLAVRDIANQRDHFGPVNRCEPSFEESRLSLYR